MRFADLRLNGFGKLEKHHLSFAPGLNLVYGPNEAGKSTLQSALLTMLYGFYDDTGYPKPVFDQELDLGFVREDGRQVYSSGLWIYRNRWKDAAYVNAIHSRLDLSGDSQHVHAHFMPAYGFIGCWAPCEKLPCGNRLIVTRRIRIAPPRFAVFERDSGRRVLSLTSDLCR